MLFSKGVNPGSRTAKGQVLKTCGHLASILEKEDPHLTREGS